MRVLVLSDSHRGYAMLRLAVEQQPRARTVFFLGDGADDIDQLAREQELLRIFQVRGNNDFGTAAPADGLAVLEGTRIYYTHGHMQQVKYGDGMLLEQARARRADIVLYGHTHQPVTRYEDGIYLMNPGSIGMGSYGVIDLTPAGIVCYTAEVRA